MYYELTDHFIVAASLENTWAFFSRAENLPRITPPWLRFTNQTPEPIHIRLDSTLDYTIRWAGIPIRWRTRIIDWTPPTQFIDLQIRGPYTRRPTASNAAIALSTSCPAPGFRESSMRWP
jgi:ligand-binding SRPBCC domain-containing protein